MIRVNLLPQKKKPDRAVAVESSGGQKWILVVLGLVLLEIIGLIVFHQQKAAELEAQNKKNNEVQAGIGSIQATVNQHQKVKADLEVLRAREQAIQKLEQARSGPTAALLELSRLLSPGKLPTIDPDRYLALQKQNPLMTINNAWDSRRVWITSFKEKSRVVQLEGYARDSTDVSELAYRLKASSYFWDVKLLPGKKDEKQTDDGVGMVSFGMQLKVRY
ncbi:MAG: PilN domain-containing protein [Polyangiaceae bacterium]